MREIPGNQKLASKWLEVDNGGDHQYNGKILKAIKRNGKFYINPVMIETRGNGGYALVCPSEGYKLRQGRFSQVPDITADERNVLIGAAKALNERPPVEPKPAPSQTRPKTPGDLSPGDDYNQRGDEKKTYHHNRNIVPMAVITALSH